MLELVSQINHILVMEIENIYVLGLYRVKYELDFVQVRIMFKEIYLGLRSQGVETLRL